MRKFLLTVATVLALYALAVDAAPKASQPHASLVGGEPQFRAQADHQLSLRPQIRIFSGTITKIGSQFVFNDDVSKTSYQLDDQETARKFDGEKVKVTGALDAGYNLIRVQSIEAA